MASPKSTLNDIAPPGLELLEVLGKGASSTVYKAKKDDKIYAIKIGNGTGSRQLETTFKQEAGVLARVHDSALPEIMDVGEHQGRAYIVMEFIPFPTLSNRIEEGIIPEATFVPILKMIAQALAKVHRRGLIHRDIKSTNILVSKEGQVKVIDFGFAAQKASIDQDKDKDKVVGTFLYSPPEQTGALARPTDGRSDLYSLGVVAFECLTGRPPFLSENLSELLQMHAAVRAPDVRTLAPEISPALAKITAKLLSKDPDDRYQTGEGLIWDLNQLDQLNQELSNGGEGFLGTSDDPTQLEESIPMVGREEEFEELIARWNEVVDHKRGSVILVEGASGSGKTRLIRELLRKAAHYDTTVLSGKCSKEDPLPFSSIRSAIDEFIGKVQRSPRDEKARLTQMLIAAAGDQASILKRFSPSLAALLQAAPDVVLKDNDHFFETICRFLESLSKALGSVIIFIDDIQWIDEGSRTVLKRLSTFLSATPVLIACTARSEEENQPSVTRFVTEMGDLLELRIQTIPLTEDAQRQLISHHLGGGQVDEALAKQLTTRASGNPFILGEYLRSIFDRNLLTYSWGNWRITGTLDDLMLSESAISLLQRRMENLSAETKEPLKMAALLGSHFSWDTLFKVVGCSPSTGNQLLAEAIRANLIEAHNSGEFAFVHDKVQEALIAFFSDDERREAHQKIAETMDQIERPTYDDLLEIARHYSNGITTKNPKRTAEVAVLAGKQSTDRGASAHAYTYFKVAMDVMMASGQPIESEFVSNLVGACINIGRTFEAQQYLEKMLESTSLAPEKRASLLLSYAVTFRSIDDHKRAAEEAAKAMALLALPIPEVNLFTWLSLPFELAHCLFLAFTGFGFGSAKGKKREANLVIASLFPGYLFANANVRQGRRSLFARLKFFKVGHSLGLTANSVKAYTELGAVVSMLFSKSIYDKLYNKTKFLAEQLNDRVALIDVMTFGNVLRYNYGERTKSVEKGELDHDSYDRYTSVATHLLGSVAIYYRLSLAGHVDKILALAEHVIKFSAARGMCSRSMAHTGIVPALAILGRTSEVQKHLKRFEPIFGLGGKSETRLIAYTGNLLQLYLEQGDFGDHIEALFSKIDAMKMNPLDLIPFYRTYYVNAGYMRLAQYGREKDAKKKEEFRGHLVRVLRDLKIAAGKCRPMLAHYNVLSAHLAHINHAPAKRQTYLAKAETLAYEDDLPWVQYEVLKLKALIHRADGATEFAQREARFAQYLALELGWVNRAKAITAEYQLNEDMSRIVRHQTAEPSVARDVGESGPTTSQSRMSRSTMSRSTMSRSTMSRSTMSRSTMSGSTMSGTMEDSTSDSGAHLKRQLDALLAVSVASAEILDPDKQREVILDEVVRILGAERGFIFLANDDGSDVDLKTARDSEQKDIGLSDESFSTHVIQKIRADKAPIVLSGTDDGEAIGSGSVVAKNLRSIIAAPLLIRDRLVGVIYLDNRLARGIFGQSDVEILLAIGNHIAVANETVRAAKLEMERQALQKDLETKKAVQMILDNLDQGFMTFDSHGVIQEGVSKAVFDLFGAQPQGKSIYELLQLDGKSLEMGKEWVRSLFEDGLIFDFAKDEGPKTFEKNKDRYVEIDYRAIESDQGTLDKVILISTDKTQERVLQAKAEEEAKKVRLVTLALMNRPVFVGYILEIRSKLGLLREMLERSPEKIDANEAFRHAHSIKGSAGACFMTQVQSLAHDFESELSKLRAGGTPTIWTERLPQLKVDLAALTQALGDFLEKNRKFVGQLDENTKRDRVFQPKQIEEVAETLKKDLGPNSPAFRKFYSTFVLENFDKLFGRFEGTIDEVARKQQKEVELEIEPTDIKVYAESYEPLMGSLIHAFRNAVDHGIETPAERQDAGKNKGGKIRVSFEHAAERTRIIIADDGRGINPKIIAKLVEERGLEKADVIQKQTEQEIIQYVFAPGFSSKTEVTDISGRGVGLDAIQSEARALGGKAWVESQMSQGTRLIVEIPHQENASDLTEMRIRTA